MGVRIIHERPDGSLLVEGSGVALCGDFESWEQFVLLSGGASTNVSNEPDVNMEGGEK